MDHYLDKSKMKIQDIGAAVAECVDILNRPEMLPAETKEAEERLQELREELKKRNPLLAEPKDKTNPKDLLGLKKPPLRLIPPAAMLYESRVMGFGAQRYGPYNWRENKVRLTVYIEAAMRHLLAKLDGEDLDSESKMPHEAHARACMGIILDALATGNLIDDRPKPGAAATLIAKLTEK